VSFSTDLEIVADLNLPVLSEWASLSSTLNLDSDTPRTCAVSLAVAKRDLIRAFISEIYIDVPYISIALSRRREFQGSPQSRNGFHFSRLDIGKGIQNYKIGPRNLFSSCSVVVGRIEILRFFGWPRTFSPTVSRPAVTYVGR